MSKTVATIIMVSASVVALRLLVPTVKRARAEGDVDASTALILGMGFLASLPIALVALTGGLTRRPDSFNQLISVFPGWYHQLDRFTLALLVGLALTLLFRQLTRGPAPIHVAGLFAIALWTVAHLSSGLHDEQLTSLRGLVLLVCLMAATVLPRGRGAAVGVGIFAVSLGVASSVVAVIARDVAFIPGCQGACSGLGFTGVLPNENLLGIALVASIPFTYLGFRGRSRTFFILYLAGMAIATGSRTAVIASVIMVITLLVVRPRLDGARAGFGRAAIVCLVLAGAVTASVFVVRHHWEPTSLTNRPALWQVAGHYIDRSPWFGYGPDRWAELADSSQIPEAAQRSTHNQWLDVLFIAGWVGAALFVSMMLAAVWSAGRARLGVLLALATILTIGTTEGMWSLGAIDLASFSLVALILTGEPGRNEAVVAVDHAAQPRRGLLVPAERTRLNGRASEVFT